MTRALLSQYKPIISTDPCAPCARGTYATGQASTVCVSCPPFTDTMSEGSSSPLDCL